MIVPFRGRLRRGFTLAELMASMAIMIILMGAMTSIIVVATHALPDDDSPLEKKAEAMDVVDQIAGELFYATSITEETANAVTFTVADRGHGAVGPETIRYAWSGTPGDPLTRQYNSGVVDNVSEDVQVFNLVYDKQVAQLEAPLRVLLVIGTDNSTDQDPARQAMIESWGYTVTQIDGAALRDQFTAAFATADVVYISKEANSGGLIELPTNPPLGIVNELRDIYPNLHLSDSNNTNSDTDLGLLDNSHFITEGFPIGGITIATSSIGIPVYTGQVAPGSRELAENWNDPALVAIDLGDQLLGGVASMGRRVKLPWGSGNFDFSALNSNGLKIMRRSIVWGGAPGAYTGAHIVLQPTSDSASRVETQVQILNRPKVNAP